MNNKYPLRRKVVQNSAAYVYTGLSIHGNWIVPATRLSPRVRIPPRTRNMFPAGTGHGTLTCQPLISTSAKFLCELYVLVDSLFVSFQFDDPWKYYSIYLCSILSKNNGIYYYIYTSYLSTIYRYL